MTLELRLRGVRISSTCHVERGMVDGAWQVREEWATQPGLLRYQVGSGSWGVPGPARAWLWGVSGWRWLWGGQ